MWIICTGVFREFSRNNASGFFFVIMHIWSYSNWYYSSADDCGKWSPASCLEYGQVRLSRFGAQAVLGMSDRVWYDAIPINNIM